MTHDVLRADIDLATKLRDDHRPDDEIILALVHRGVDPGQAAQLLDELRKGISPTLQSPVPSEMSLARRSRTRGVAPGNGPARPSHSSRARARSGAPTESADRGRKKPAVVWLTAAIFAGLVLTAGAVILIQRHKAGANAVEEQKPKAAMPKVNEAPHPAPAKAAVPSPNVPPPSLVLELQPDGLHLGGGLVTGGNVLTAVANLLGVPTRTNQVGRTDTVIYAYDHQGLLIYSQKSGGTNSIVLDCEAIGGPNGTTSPFTGSLKVEDRVIGPGTDSQTLAAIKKLELNRPGTGGSVWSGHYNGLDLVFAYLKSPQRLSLIEIDLK
jgi:hypothetical protein